MTVLSRFDKEYLRYHDITEPRRREVLKHLHTLEVRSGVAIEEVPAEQVRAYITELAVDRTPPTMGKILSQIKPFFVWAWENQIITAEHLMTIKAVRPPRGAAAPGKPRPYSAAERVLLWRDWDRRYALPGGVDVERALWFVQRWENGTSKWSRVKPLAWRYQSRAMIALGMMGGLRRDEIYRLTPERAHYENEYVVVHGARKNQAAEERVRAVPWTTPEMRDALRDWIDLRERIVPGHDGLWLSMVSTPHIRTPLPYETFEMVMSKMGRGWEFHRLRHTAGTEMLRAGYPLETVRKIMGHSRIQQTLAYVELLTEDVVRVAGNCEMQLSTALAAAAA